MARPRKNNNASTLDKYKALLNSVLDMQEDLENNVPLYVKAVDFRGGKTSFCINPDFPEDAAMIYAIVNYIANVINDVPMSRVNFAVEHGLQLPEVDILEGLED